MADFKVTLDRKVGITTKVNYTTVDGTAVAGGDYVAKSGTLTFGAGETEKKISIDLLPRNTKNERYFDVVLTGNSFDGEVSGRCSIVPRVTNGPLVNGGLITNSYHDVDGRGGYFHHNAGTSEGQSIAIEAAFMAYDALGETEAGLWYKNLALSMLDAMGDGSANGPILRQPIPSDPNTITVLHWLFAAKGAIPAETANYSYTASTVNGTLTIPQGNVTDVWQIYPTDSYLLYESPHSPAFDAQGNETQVAITNYNVFSNSTVIDIPQGAPQLAQWNIVFSYENGTIGQGEAFEAYPFWTKIEDGYATCAPDTFRWFELALTQAYDKTADTKWLNLRNALRRSAVKGQNITDLREVLTPMPNFPAIPQSGDPTCMFCYSTHPYAKPPLDPNVNQSWIGYNFWSRNNAGHLEGMVPQTNVLSQVQIGRGFNDEWRQATSYQEADQYLFVSMAMNANLGSGAVYVFLSSSKTYDPESRWYADVSELPEWSNVVTKYAQGQMVNLYIPRTLFKRKDFDGAVLQAGQRINNFGVSIETTQGYIVEIAEMRLTSSMVELSANLPYFPASMPFSINADTIRQKFVGFNGSPFHGYQLPDLWFYLGDDAEAVHPNLTVLDLPACNPSTGIVEYPISPEYNGQPKPKHALLMEQQLLFLKHAQDRYELDGGIRGPFAHTFVLNTAARYNIGNPTPHTWVYTNEDPNTRWSGYQARVVESLAKTVYLTNGVAGFEECHALSKSIVQSWLGWLFVNQSSIFEDGIPTDFDDPSISAPQTLYHDPHAPALVLRACMWLKLANAGFDELCDYIAGDCWLYLESQWNETGEIRYTWSPNPTAGEWFGFWHFEIISTLSILINEASTVLPAVIDIQTVTDRLEKTYIWLKNTGVK